MSLHDYAKTRFESICAGEYCPSCQCPTIVSSVGEKSLIGPCECIRNRPKEWLLLSRIVSIPPNSLVVVDPNEAPTTSGGNNRVQSMATASARSYSQVGDKERLNDMSRAIAKFALTKSGYSFGPAADERLERLDPPAPDMSFADFSRSALDQVTTVFAEIERKYAKEGDLLSHFSPHEIDFIVQQLRSRPESLSCQAYNSALLRAPERPLVPLHEIYKRLALTDLDPDAQDFLPNQSALSVRSTASNALSQIGNGSGISAAEWL